jgi:hypothetical protein
MRVYLVEFEQYDPSNNTFGRASTEFLAEDDLHAINQLLDHYSGSALRVSHIHEVRVLDGA